MVAVQSYVYTLFLCFAALPVLAQEVLHDGKTYVKADNFGFTLNLVSGLEEAPLEARSPGALGDAVLEKRQGSRCINPLWDHYDSDFSIKDYTGCVTEEMELKYEPDKKTRADNRSKKCPDDFCNCDPANPNTPCNQYYQFIDFSASQLSNNHPFQLTCDEFPFANSKEGGNPNRGTSICVPAWQQNIQGGYLSGIGKRASGPDRSYILKIVGWDCATRRPKSGFSTNCGGRAKREIETTSSRDVTGQDLWMDFEQPGENYLLLYIGDLPPGVYTYDLNLNAGSFSDVSIIDKLGEQYAAIPGFNAKNGRQTISFNLQYGAPGLALMGITRDTNISMAYNATGATGADAVPKKSSAAGALLGLKDGNGEVGIFALPGIVAFGMAAMWM
ncbi:hypothetical protein I7I51_07180 [Histoplasma capsulatum]|uniref:Deoxyribonuclease NucA/NucB domain-containing protein n=1 Tax=Ajellomyces capsulatus TaxID=5037 RepID=A0A8A1MNX2_AJECA|nr:predicted protein [Histoplasma mississippiense (nom. inval.)]EDN10003.1 predicted protein [Histoplasma mississippiense (nom. inval.)]QSS66323.1 hypothetical protein I7I51_07180 [Histoplasma capsulatum]